MLNYKKSQLTAFAKGCAWGANQMLNGICMAGEIAKNPIGRSLPYDEGLLLEVSKRFAKHCKDGMAFDVDNSEVQDFQNIIELIIGCCEENNWFID